MSYPCLICELTLGPSISCVLKHTHLGGVLRPQVEAELRELDPVEAAEYLASLGAQEGGLASLIRAAYRLLGLRTYFTTG